MTKKISMMIIILIMIFGSIIFSEGAIMPENNDIKKIHLRELDFQIESDGNDNILSGIAIVYKTNSEPMYDFIKRKKYIEIILPGAITESILYNDVRCLHQHDNKYVLGRTKNNTLKLNEQIEGLYFSVEIPDTTWATDLSKSVKRGDIDKMSFGFYPLESNWLDDENTISKYGMPVREISKLKLIEISIVSNPAYTETDVRELENEYLESNNEEHQKNIEAIALKSKQRERELELKKKYI